MSLTPRLTLIGLYKYNPSVFENLVLPNIVDDEIFIDSLMLEYGECPLIYPDFDFMKLAIGAWSRKWYNNIERIATAIQEEYNPLYNYDRTETWTENEEGTKDFTRGIVDGESETENQTITENRTVNEDGTITENGTVSEEGTENTSKTETENKTDENQVSAYNEDNYQPSTKTITDRTTQTDTETETEKLLQAQIQLQTKRILQIIKRLRRTRLIEETEVRMKHTTKTTEDRTLKQDALSVILALLHQPKCYSAK